MKNNEYFVPDIEDLRIGYEGEINWNRAYEDNFVPFTIKVQDREGAYTNEISDIVNAVDDGYAEVRTPYLTKEQILAEGWLPNGIDAEEDGVNFKKSNWVGMVFNHHDYTIQIYEVNPIEDWNLYKGECKSINEFRYICKLLKI